MIYFELTTPPQCSLTVCMHHTKNMAAYSAVFQCTDAGSELRVLFDWVCSIAINSTILEVYNSSMENVAIHEGIVCLKNIKVVECKTKERK